MCVTINVFECQSMYWCSCVLSVFECVSIRVCEELSASTQVYANMSVWICMITWVYKFVNMNVCTCKCASVYVQV